MLLSSEISTLYALAHELLYLGMDDTPIYSDHFGWLNNEVFHKANALYFRHGGDIEEESALCLSVLMAYSATLCDNGDKQDRIQHILDRCWDVLPKLPASLLKVRLLTYCYGEVFEEELADEAYTIIRTWDTSSLTPEQLEIQEELKNIQDNPYPWREGTE